MNTEEALTRRQKEIFDFLTQHQDSFGQPPSLDELCQEMGLSSRGSLHKHIQALIKAGLVEPANRKQRGIRLTKKDSLILNELPLVGYIAAGSPIEAIEDSESIGVPAQLQGRGTCFVLQVKGDSMVDDGILDGDWVIIEQRSQARDGEIVVALIDGMDATLKHIEQHPNETILHPANKNMKPMHFNPHQINIQGVLVGQMRSYQT